MDGASETPVPEEPDREFPPKGRLIARFVVLGFASGLALLFAFWILIVVLSIPTLGILSVIALAFFFDSWIFLASLVLPAGVGLIVGAATSAWISLGDPSVRALRLAAAGITGACSIAIVWPALSDWLRTSGPAQVMVALIGSYWILGPATLMWLLSRHALSTSRWRLLIPLEEKTH